MSTCVCYIRMYRYMSVCMYPGIYLQSKQWNMTMLTIKCVNTDIVELRPECNWYQTFVIVRAQKENSVQSAGDGFLGNFMWNIFPYFPIVMKYCRRYWLSLHFKLISSPMWIWGGRICLKLEGVGGISEFTNFGNLKMLTIYQLKMEFLRSKPWFFHPGHNMSQENN